jgi:hypothetical protein
MGRPDWVRDETSSHHVITGLVPVNSIIGAQRFSDRDGRGKPGHDTVGLSLFDPAGMMSLPVAHMEKRRVSLTDAPFT